MPQSRLSLLALLRSATRPLMGAAFYVVAGGLILSCSGEVGDSDDTKGRVPIGPNLFDFAEWCRIIDCDNLPVRIYDNCMGAVMNDDHLCISINKGTSQTFTRHKVKSLSSLFVEFSPALVFPRKDQDISEAVFYLISDPGQGAQFECTPENIGRAKASWHFTRGPSMPNTSVIFSRSTILGVDVLSLNKMATLKTVTAWSSTEPGGKKGAVGFSVLDPKPKDSPAATDTATGTKVELTNYQICANHTVDIKLGNPLAKDQHVLWYNEPQPRDECISKNDRIQSGPNGQVALSMGLLGTNPRYENLCAYYYQGCEQDATLQDCNVECRGDKILLAASGERTTCQLDETSHKAAPGSCNFTSKNKATLISEKLKVGVRSTDCQASDMCLSVTSTENIIPSGPSYSVLLRGRFDLSVLYRQYVGGFGCGGSPGKAEPNVDPEIEIMVSNGAALRGKLTKLKEFTVETKIGGPASVMCSKLAVSLTVSGLPPEIAVPQIYEAVIE